MTTCSRLSVNISDRTAASLRELAESRGTTVTEVVQRAVAVNKYLEDAEREGQHIQVVDRRTGEAETVTLL